MEPFSRYTKVILTIYFVLGLPMLPLALLMLLMRRYIFEDRKFFKLENRKQLVIDLCCYMIVFTSFGGLMWLMMAHLR